MTDTPSRHPDAAPANDLPAPAVRASTPLLRQRLRGRFAALSVIGGVMVTLPLLQVLRYQNAEVQALATERAGLDPVARAVELQRSLLLHRDLAAGVLRGQAALEPERLLRQNEVDDRAGTLAAALANGAWQPAIKESDALREDWSLLARQVLRRAVSAPESDAAHRLLVEQTLQVVDLVADATMPQAGVAPALADAGDDTVQTLAAAHALPRLAWQLALLATPAATREAAAAAAIELAAAETNVARALGAMNAAVDHQLLPADHLRLASATASAGAAADHYFGLLHQPPRRSSTAELQDAAANAVQAQLQLFTLATTTVGERLAEQAAAAELRRSLFVSLMAVLALTALWLISSLARRLDLWQRTALHALADAPALQAATTAQPSELQRLLQRLRQGDDERWTKARRPQEQPLPTLPPEI